MKECSLPLIPVLSNSPRPRQDTRRPDFPRFLQDTEEAGRGKASIRAPDYQPPAPHLPEREAPRVFQYKETRPSGFIGLGRDPGNIAERICEPVTVSLEPLSNVSIPSSCIVDMPPSLCLPLYVSSGRDLICV